MMFMSFNLFANTLAIDEERFLAFHKAALPDSSVVVVDVTNPGNPVQINNIDISEGVRSLYLDKLRNLLFVSLTVPGIKVFDVSDINTPTLVGSWTEGASFNLSIQDNIA